MASTIQQQSMLQQLSASHSELKQRREGFTQLIAKLRTISQKLTFQGLERINSVTLFEVKAKHTNEVTVQLGGGYFAQVTVPQAIGLFQRRLKAIDEQIARIGKEKQERKEQDNVKTVGKAKSAKIEEGGKRGYMQLVGEENGQEIFNIVEIQGEDEEDAPEKQTQTAPASTEAATAPAPEDKTEKKETIQPKKEDNQSEGSISQQQVQKSEKSFKSQQSEDEQQDLIHSHYKKKLGIKLNPSPTAIASTPQITASKSQTQNTEKDPAKPDVKSEKKKKRVSFADERDGGKLQQLLKEEQQAKVKDKKQKKQSRKQQKSVKVVNQKQKATVRQQFQKPPAKVSKFKQQRMKQRMQKQGK